MGCPLRLCTNCGFFIAMLTYRRVYQKQEYFGPDLGEAMISDILQNQSVGNRKIMSGQQRLDSLPEGNWCLIRSCFAPCFTNWWFQPSLKILVRLDYYSPLGQNASPVPSRGGDGPYHTRGLAPSNPCDAFLRPVFPPWIPSEVTRL